VTPPDLNPYLTAKDVAQQLMVSTNTIRLWTEKGLLPCETTLGGHRRFLRSDVEKIVQTQGIANAKKTPSILIIEDEVDLANTIAEGLQEAVPGLAVLVANDGFTGGLKASLHKPDYVLLDLMMPGINGIEVCRQLKQEAHTRHARVIAFTGHATDAQMQAVIAEGAEVCLIKPLRIAQLLQVIGISN
jgi:excisionase family DNA binding protein